MEMNDYQRGAMNTAHFTAVGGFDMVYPALKLAGEAGEVAEKVGKFFRDTARGRGPREITAGEWESLKVDLTKELGDVLWYVAVLSYVLNISLDTVASTNLAKLADRQRRGVIHGNGDDR